VHARSAKAAEAASKLRSEETDAEAIALAVTNAVDRIAATQFIKSHYGKLDLLITHRN
jgi:hypothetical protein